MDRTRECIADGHCRPRHRSAKNMRRWCRGRVGVEHSWAWVPLKEFRKYRRGDYETHSDGSTRRYFKGGFWRRVEMQECSACQRIGEARRSFCHCGELMVEDERGRFNAILRCPGCGMTNWWPQVWSKQKNDWIDAPDRPVHQCAVVPVLGRYRYAAK